MQLILGEVRYRRTEDKAGRRSLLLGIMGQKKEGTFITAQVCEAFLKLKILTSGIEISYLGRSKVVEII